MLLKAFSILDIKSDTFAAPFFFSTTGQAVRAFKDLANDERSSVHRHPGDYRLFCIGSFEDQVGQLSRLDTIEPLGYASDYRDLPGTPIGVNGLKAVP